MSTRLLGTPLAPIRGQRIRLSDPLLRGLVGYWVFNEGGGGRVADHSLYGNTGTWNGTGTHWAAGKFGWAGQFNGTDDYVQVNDTASLSVGDAFTIVMWIYIDSTGTWNSLYIDWYDNNNKSIHYALATGALSLFVSSDGSAQDNLNAASPSSLAWHHVAVTFEAGDVVHYLNGGISNSGTITETSVFNSSRPKTFGVKSSVSHENPFDGRIGNPSIYNRALTAAEIGDLYLLGARAGFHTRTLFPAAAAAGFGGVSRILGGGIAV